jgi:5-methylcytosine-specific restriction endonuclease McrA
LEKYVCDVSEADIVAFCNEYAMSWGRISSTRSLSPGRINSAKRIIRMRRARALGTHDEDEWLLLVYLCKERCVICGVHKSDLIGNVFTKDHVLPISLGGSDAIDNIQPLCRHCNSGKRDIDDHVAPEVRAMFRGEGNIL